MLPHQNSIFDHLEGVGRNLPHSGTKVPYIAIPTTSGTGGEVTKNAVISEVGENGYKKSLRHDNFIPDAVIVDGTLLISCPKPVTAACGLDTFTQLLEPYLSPTASPLTDAIAWSGLEAIADNLLLACGEGATEIAVRESMAYASLCSGIALYHVWLNAHDIRSGKNAGVLAKSSLCKSEYYVHLRRHDISKCGLRHRAWARLSYGWLPPHSPWSGVWNVNGSGSAGQLASDEGTRARE
ncbi:MULTISPECIES: iron-containing alcohol dehydrogenase [unclassified Leptolyngbya]|uniref:iron-containing alcohol dehydrogenase n=1 Tax=unclassified Leptolyngbya TaxID=2650499 RepID=UPI00321FBD63